ncbi:MAG: DUF6893 family small protein [Vicinamibacteria bacterium]
MKKFLGLLAALLAVGVILQLPDIQRYLKIRRM